MTHPINPAHHAQVFRDHRRWQDGSEHSDSTGATPYDAVLAGAKLTDLILARNSLARDNLSSTILAVTILADAILASAVIVGTNLTGSELAGAVGVPLR